MIVIYYIATSVYKKGFETFKKCLPKFFPEQEKTVVVISDGLEECSSEEKITYKFHYIEHLPWPIITLFKMQYILDYWEDGDQAYYFNADFHAIHDGYKYLDLTKLNSDLLTGPRFIETNDKSQAFIENKQTLFASGGFFGGPSYLVKQMCEEVCSMMRKDLRKNIIPKWHDQGYLNRWCYNNLDKINVTRFLGKLFLIHFIHKPKIG